MPQSPVCRSTAVFLITTAFALLGCGLSARAGVTPLPTDADISGGGATWNVRNNQGTSNGLPLGGNGSSSPGLGISDATLTTTSQGDAFDSGVIVWVNDEVFIAPPPAQITPVSYAAGPVQMSGLQVSVDYYAVQTDPILRTQAVFTNPSNFPITATITLTTNVGSDSSTQVIATSSGDTAFTTADHWIITDDGSTTGGDPTNTHVLANGNTGLLVETGLTVFNSAATNGVLARYSLTVPANSTRRLLFFNELNSSAAEAVTDVARYDNITPDSPLLVGLSGNDREQVVNFQFGVSQFGRLTGSGTVGNGRNPFSVEATATQGVNRGQLVYTDVATRRTVRSVTVNAVGRVGNTVQMSGTARINNGGLLPFNASFQDNGASGDIFRLQVGGVINVGPTPLRTGNILITP